MNMTHTPARVLLHDHEPDDVVFGPVNSRRFGRSFGISLSYAGKRCCRWHCAYCQLGHLPVSDTGAWVSPSELQAVLDRANPGDADVICCSGSGENLDHPQFLDCFALMQAFAKRWQRPLIILTNGDALLEESLRSAVLNSRVRCYVKWDFGVRDGAWRSMSTSERLQRMEILEEMPQLRLQSMFTHQAHEEALSQRKLEQWFFEVLQLRPVEVHMTTISRPSFDQKLSGVPLRTLQPWADGLRQRLGIPVSIFADATLVAYT